MSKAKKAKRGDTILLLNGLNEGYKAIASGGGNRFIARVITGPNQGKDIIVLDGDYMVVGG